MATKLKVNYEFVGDSTTPVTRTNSIKHGDKMLNTVIESKADSSTVSTLSSYIYNNSIVVEKYDGDNYSEKLQNAINSNSNGIIYLPEGTVEIKNVVLPSSKTFMFVGKGMRADNNGGTHVVSSGDYIFLDNNNDSSYCSFINIDFDGRNTTKSAIYMSKGTGHYISRCTFKNFSEIGCYLGLGLNVVEHCYFKAPLTSMALCKIHSDSRVIDSEFSGGESGLVITHNGIAISDCTFDTSYKCLNINAEKHYDAESIEARNIKITNCYFGTSHGYNIYTNNVSKNVDGLLISNTYFELTLGNNDGGVYLKNAKGINIDDCRFLGTRGSDQGYGINFVNCEDGIINSSNFLNMANESVRLENSSDVTISSCRFRDCDLNNINLISSARILIVACNITSSYTGAISIKEDENSYYYGVYNLLGLPTGIRTSETNLLTIEDFKETIGSITLESSFTSIVNYCYKNLKTRYVTLRIKPTTALSIGDKIGTLPAFMIPRVDTFVPCAVGFQHSAVLNVTTNGSIHYYGLTQESGIEIYATFAV